MFHWLRFQKPSADHMQQDLLCSISVLYLVVSEELFTQTAELDLNLFGCDVPLLNPFIRAVKPRHSASQDQPHCPHSTPTKSPACLRSVHYERCFSVHGPPTQPSPSSCECDDRSERPQRTLSDPLQVGCPLWLPSLNVNKQERDPFLPTVAQPWKPTPLPSHSEGNPLLDPHSTSCLTD